MTLGKKFKVIREITIKECCWLENNILKDTIIYIYDGYTYGCITHTGVAVTVNYNELPFFEVPKDAIKGI